MGLNFGGLSAQFADFMRGSDELPREDRLHALTHRAYPAVVGCLDAFLGGKRRVQIFDCAAFLGSPSEADYAHAIAAFKRLLRAAVETLRADAALARLPLPADLVVTEEANAPHEQVVVLARGTKNRGFDACVTGVKPPMQPHASLLATRCGAGVKSAIVPNPGTSAEKTVDAATVRALLAPVREDLAIFLVRTDAEGEQIAAAAEASRWNVARVLGEPRGAGGEGETEDAGGEGEGSRRLSGRTVVVWNVAARGWATCENPRVADACTLRFPTRVSRCFALVYECAASTWVPRALGQIVGPMDERRHDLVVTFFR